MTAFTRSFVFLCLVLSLAGHAQVPADAPCEQKAAAAAGKKGSSTFARFDAEFRSAIQRQDPAALSFLVNFPLRVNTDKGTLLIPDAASLAGHFQEVFPPAVRKAILATTRDDYVCRYDEGIAYKDGVAWVQDSGGPVALWSVNSPDTGEKRPEPRLIYTCDTKTHRIAIDAFSNGEVRYRSWNKPRPLSEAPDVDLRHGKTVWEGTGVCSGPTFSFETGKTVYEVQGGLGCTDGSEPKNATGRLSVTIAGKHVTNDWCL